jgi:hypothetical protein
MKFFMRDFSIGFAMFWSQWGYWWMVAVAIWAHAYLPAGSVRTVLILTPILPGLIILWLSYYFYEASDEYIRFRVLKAGTLTALTLALFTLVYSFLELLGFPRLSAAWIALLGWSVFVIQMLVLYRSK